MSTLLPSFQQYQLEFTSHIRNPRHSPRPPKVAAKRMKVYTEIVFNNLESSVAACFPIARTALGVRAWKKLIRGFFADHQSHSPLFRQIPEEFLRYLDSLAPQIIETLPPYLKSLMHYEWVELALAVAEVSVDMDDIDAEGDLMAGQPVLPPALALLSYAYPVQLISARFRPVAPLAQPVHLLVFRDSEDEVRFIEINQVTARLLQMIQTGTVSGRKVLQELASEMQHPEPETLLRFGESILMELKAQGAILGVTKSR